VVITDPLPPELEYRGFAGTSDIDSVDYDSATHTLTIIFVDPLESGKTGDLMIHARFIPGTTPDGTVATNQATIDADNSPADLSEQSASRREPATGPRPTRATATPLGGSPTTYTDSVNNTIEAAQSDLRFGKT
jgi:hypothetical protein